MTLYEIVGILKQIALTQPNVKSATDGSIYDVMNATNSVKYDVVHLSQTKHITDEETDTYGFNIFYVSRLEDSLEDNRLQIQSIGKEVLDNILRTFCENWNIDYPEIIFYPFTQKFADLCAGCYCKVEIEVPKAIICADNFIEEITPSKGIKLENVVVEVDQNGTRIVTPSPGFDGIGKVTIVTDVTGGSCNLEYKEVEYTENGEYTVLPSSGYDGLSGVAVSISVPQGQGYEEGYEDGVADQKAKLSSTSFTQNNSTFTRMDGWSSVTIAVDDRYDEGYADGFAAGASACSGYFITALTLNVDSAITDSGIATSTYSPESAITDIYYTSSDPSIATIDSGTGVITVLSSGTVTICAIDRYSDLRSCQAVTVNRSGYTGPVEVIYDVTSTTNPTQILEANGRGRLDFDYFVYDSNVYTIDADTTGFTFPTIGRHTVEYHSLKPSIDLAFWGCDRLVEARIPGNITALTATFVNTSLSAITLSEDLVVVSDAFRNTDLVNITIPNSVESIVDNAFYNCVSLSSVSLGNSVAFVGNNAFRDCSALTGLTFPSALGTAPAPKSRIYGWAFSGCTSLSHLTFLSETPAFLIEDGQFTDTNNCPIYVPANAVDTYKSAWSTVRDRITAIIP